MHIVLVCVRLAVRIGDSSFGRNPNGEQSRSAGSNDPIVRSRKDMKRKRSLEGMTPINTTE